MRLSRLTHLQYVFASLLGLPAQKCDHVRCPVRSCPICFLVGKQVPAARKLSGFFLCWKPNLLLKACPGFFPCWKQVVCCQKISGVFLCWKQTCCQKLSGFLPCWTQLCCQKVPTVFLCWNPGSKSAVKSCPASLLVGRRSAARKCEGVVLCWKRICCQEAAGLLPESVRCLSRKNLSCLLPLLRNRSAARK